jgi:hypothetical protein
MGLAYNILTPAKSIKSLLQCKEENAAAERVLEILDQQTQLHQNPMPSKPI